jgi:hypothetical protein
VNGNLSSELKGISAGTSQLRAFPTRIDHPDFRIPDISHPFRRLREASAQSMCAAVAEKTTDHRNRSIPKV